MESMRGSAVVERQAHNLKVEGSSPSPATKFRAAPMSLTGVAPSSFDTQAGGGGNL